MLGRTIADPDGVDGRAGTVEGLGLLDIATVMTSDKSTTLVTGTHCASGAAIEGYEIHLGRSQGGDCVRPVLTIEGRADGASSADGRVQGTYVHGLFTGDAFRKAWLRAIGIASSLAYEARIELALDALADHLEAHLDIEQILEIARAVKRAAPAPRRLRPAANTPLSADRVRGRFRWASPPCAPRR